MRARIGKRPLLLAVGTALLLALGGCAYGGPGYYDGYYDPYNDGYYDDYYGPFLGGYWANDGFFYYWSQAQRYHRDDGRHFRRDRFPGAKPFHGDRDGHRGDRRDGPRDDHRDRPRGGGN